MFRPLFLICQVTLCSLLFVVAAAQAHEVRPALAEVSFMQDRYEINFTVNLEALLAEIESEHEDTNESDNAGLYNSLRAMPPAILLQKFETFKPRLLNGLSLEAGGKPMSVTTVIAAVPEIGDLDLARDSSMTLTGPIPAGSSSMTFAWSSSFGSLVFRTTLDEDGEGYSAYLQNGETSEAIAFTGSTSQSVLSVFIDYIAVGFEHIIPLGLDHILFVIGLFLFSVNFRPLLIQVSAFTVAHTVTLALGLFGVISIAPSVIEPLIALSIVYVAIENIFFKTMNWWRPILVFAFGLLHGLGFASVLAEFGLPKGQYVVGLIAFNIGVELGQLFVVAACFAVVGYWFGKKTWYRKAVVIPGSLAIAAIGTWWVIERTVL
jgi:hypothetical protein